ncbi:DUF6132 family protein [uncultured Bacteroides sp.]|uniref:DUF6132 family protein n=1 Tax=uncultured Bacteroides sp. TaxID=162156 RepID=UPI002AAC1A4E|nr:DUF6132 family protein [uncultured Bacteroides sp.]
MKALNDLWRKNSLFLIGAVIGAIGGYLYWFYVGCASGTCPITSSPIMSVIWGAILGGLILSMFQKNKKKQDE